MLQMKQRLREQANKVTGALKGFLSLFLTEKRGYFWVVKSLPLPLYPNNLKSLSPLLSRKKDSTESYSGKLNISGAFFCDRLCESLFPSVRRIFLKISFPRINSLR